MSDAEKEKAVDFMLHKIDHIQTSSYQFRQLIELFTAAPTEQGLQDLRSLFEEINLSILEITPKAELFEQEAVFPNIEGNPEFPIINSLKLGKLEQAITEQIEKVDEEIQTSASYSSYNVMLANRMLGFNLVLDACMSNLLDKL